MREEKGRRWKEKEKKKKKFIWRTIAREGVREIERERREKGRRYASGLKPPPDQKCWLRPCIYRVGQKTYIHRESKKETPYSSSYLHQIFTDFKTSFTGTFSRTFAILPLPKIPAPHLKNVATLPCKISCLKLASTAVTATADHALTH